MLFPWYTKYPYQNDEVLNLDWVLKTIDSLVKEVADFVTLNSIKYADPIQWNITTQYEKNTLVIDPISGTAYLSTKPVPAGVGLNNTDYWTVVFTLDVLSANKNITLRDDANNMLATFESAIGDWVLWQGTLYVVTRAIEIGQAYVEDYNIERATVEYFLKLYISNLSDYVNTLVGDLDDLTTEDKDSIVAAINEVLGALGTLATNVGTLTNLNTSDKTSIVIAINEVIGYIGSLSSLNTTNKSSIVNAINEVLVLLGDLTGLTTTNKSSAVAAINEINAKTNLLTNKRFIVLGDSFLAGTNVDGPDPLTSWGALVKSWLGLSNDNMILLPLGGAGFVSQGISYSFINLLQNASISSPDTITDIVVTGGTNDANNATTTQVENAIASFCTYCKTNFPNAKIHIGYLGGIRAAGWQKNVDSHNMVTCYKKCAKYGASFIENVQYTIRRLTYLQTDKVHPNQTGQNFIAECFANWFLNGDYEVISGDIGYVGTLGSDVSSGLVTIRQSQHNSQINLEILATQPLASTKGSTTLNGENAYELSDISSDGFILGYDIAAGFSTAATDVTFNFHDGTRWRNGQGTLQIRGGKLLLYPSVMDETNNNWFTVTVGSIWLGHARNITFDALNV